MNIMKLMTDLSKVVASKDKNALNNFLADKMGMFEPAVLKYLMKRHLEAAAEGKIFLLVMGAMDYKGELKPVFLECNATDTPGGLLLDEPTMKFPFSDFFNIILND